MKEWGIIVMKTVVKELACKEVGDGAMAEPATICNLISELS